MALRLSRIHSPEASAMRAVSRPPDASTRPLLAGATFADAFSIDINEPGINASTAAERSFAKAPLWVDRLLSVRNAVVRPFGLKGTNEARKLSSDHIGFFPCISRSADRVVMGFNDSHLDFRVAVDVAGIASGQQRITATTLVRPHNLFGRTYLVTIMPFHKLIVRTMLARVQST
jgi:Protein of unknown function (DUF2867)